MPINGGCFQIWVHQIHSKDKQLSAAQITCWLCTFRKTSSEIKTPVLSLFGALELALMGTNLLRWRSVASIP